MMIASGEQRCARWGAQGSGVEARVAQAHLREAIEIRSRHLTAERAPLTKARVVDQDEQYVRSAGGSFGQLDRPGFGVFVGPPDLRVREELLRSRQRVRTSIRRHLR